MSIPGKKVLVPLLVIILAISQIQQVRAAKGTPGTQQFGFGTRIDPRGTQVDEALRLLVDLHPDWLYLPVDWAAYSPTAVDQPDFSQIVKIITFAGQNQIAVILSLQSPPDWAMTVKGPDPERTADVILSLVKHHPQVVLGLELYPLPVEEVATHRKRAATESPLTAEKH